MDVARFFDSKMPESLRSVLHKCYDEYVNNTSKKLKMIDAYLAYIMLTGIMQFVYCCLVGTFPFNSFLSGFISCVGSFVLAGESRDTNSVAWILGERVVNLTKLGKVISRNRQILTAENDLGDLTLSPSLPSSPVLCSRPQMDEEQ